MEAKEEIRLLRQALKEAHEELSKLRERAARDDALFNRVKTIVDEVDESTRARFKKLWTATNNAATLLDMAGASKEQRALVLKELRRVLEETQYGWTAHAKSEVGDDSSGA
jgi:hypothetical protein